MSAFFYLKKLFFKRFVDIAVVLAVIAIATVLYFYFSNFDGKLSSAQDTWGQFGDFVGGSLNPILGFISVLVLVATLNLQREELKEVREATKEGNDLIEMQVKAIHLQSLESTFFKILEEFDRNPLTIMCREDKCELNLYYAVFGYIKREEGGILENGFKSKNDYFSKITAGRIVYGAFKYLVVGKIINLVEIANSLPNNQIHYSLIQSAVGPRLLCAAVHFVLYEDPEKYSQVLLAKRAFLGTNANIFYNDRIAEDFLLEQQYKKYLDNKEGMSKRREAMLKLREAAKVSK